MTPPTGPESVTAALVGRLNTGKTSLVMHLTGSVQKPVNFPGTSVERSESTVRVNGTVLRERGEDRVDADGELPGRLLRGGCAT